MKPLNERSKQVRRDTLKLSSKHGGYHYGGCFSITEVLIMLYDAVLRQKDKFILSKGHSVWPLYVLLREKGLNPTLGGHPSLDVANGIHYTTGSEGHGFPAAVGMALARKLTGMTGRVFVVIGDGECQEGTTWESLLMAAHYGLDNLTVIVDWNGFQGSGAVKEILNISSLPGVARMIGWSVSEIDGHDCDEIKRELKNFEINKPRLIIAHTIKGRGVSYMEDRGEWHSRFPNKDEYKQALEDLE